VAMAIFSSIFWNLFNFLLIFSYVVSCSNDTKSKSTTSSMASTPISYNGGGDNNPSLNSSTTNLSNDNTPGNPTLGASASNPNSPSPQTTTIAMVPAPTLAVIGDPIMCNSSGFASCIGTWPSVSNNNADPYNGCKDQYCNTNPSNTAATTHLNATYKCSDSGLWNCVQQSAADGDNYPIFQCFPAPINNGFVAAANVVGASMVSGLTLINGGQQASDSSTMFAPCGYVGLPGQ